MDDEPWDRLDHFERAAQCLRDLQKTRKKMLKNPTLNSIKIAAEIELAALEVLDNLQIKTPKGSK